MAIDPVNTAYMDSVYSNVATFKARAMEEIQRIRRYPAFVSLISIDLSQIDIEAEFEARRSSDELIGALRTLIRKSIRVTDLLSGAIYHKLLILLVETPREGAKAVANRLSETVNYFIANNVKLPVRWQVPITEYHYPAVDDEKNSILSALEEI